MTVWRNWLEKEFILAEGTKKIVLVWVSKGTTTSKIENEASKPFRRYLLKLM